MPNNTTKANEVYPNPPLVETVFEISFSGELSIECSRDKFHKKIKKDYPKLLVPRFREGIAIALEPYSFEKEDGAYTIGLSVNRLFISCKNYKGYYSFKTEVLKIINIFREMFSDITFLKRTGLRYINIIPFTREKGIIPLTSYLNINIELPKSIPNIFKNLNMNFVSQTEGGNILTRIEPLMAPNKSEAIILDFDYAKEGSLSIKSVEQYLEESHKHTKHLFEELVTEKFRTIMRGDVV